MNTVKRLAYPREWPILAKILLAVLALWFIFKQLAEGDFYEFLDLYRNLAANPNNWFLFIVLDLLMALNWYIEAIKWKVLIDKFEKVGVFTALRATLSGVTISFFTPNRVGEFAGRIMHLGPGSRLKGVLASLIGSASQLLVTILFGSFGLAFFLPSFFDLNSIYLALFITAALLICILLLYMFFHFGFLSRVLTHLKVLNRFEKHLMVFQSYTSIELIKILGFSVLRYIVFSVQFVIMLQMMHIDLGFLFLFGLVTVIYLVLTIIPTLAILTELPVRGSVAIYIIGQYSQEHLGILCASFSIWLLNLVLPAIIGSASIFYFRFTK